MKLPEQYKVKMQKLLKDEYNDYLLSLDKPRHYGLRANTLKVAPTELSELFGFDPNPIRWCKQGMYYCETERPSKSVFYNAGLFYLQEPSAMSAASALDVRPGDRVLDICAAPGGKTTQLGAALNGCGVLFANDLSASRAKPLLRNVELFGIRNSVITIESPERLSEKLPQYFNKILVDAPCSGEGMFRKNPDTIKVWNEYMPNQFIPIQRKILSHSARMLAEGGNMLYSTCTFDPDENEGNIIWFLENHPNFELLSIPGHAAYGFDNGLPAFYNVLEDVKKCARLMPHKINGEGHFLALLHKKYRDPDFVRKSYNDENFLLHKKYSYPSELTFKTSQSDSKHSKNCAKPSSAAKSKPKNYNSMNNLEYFYEFMQKYMCTVVNSELQFHGDSLYSLPADVPDLSGLRIMRTGLLLGEVKKKRFEPSQALAMSVKKEDVRTVIDLSRDDEKLMRYLKGESIFIDVGTDGWHLICVEGYPLGWGKIIDGRLKNKYPAGWKLE